MGGEGFIFCRAGFQCFLTEFGELFRQRQIGVGFAEIIVNAGKPFRQCIRAVSVIFKNLSIGRIQNHVGDFCTSVQPNALRSGERIRKCLLHPVNVTQIGNGGNFQIRLA